jgi:8-oxo-dGTP pyrophosphatase MutT (NUDIX family)
VTHERPDGGRQRIVGAAILRHGQVLAARRTKPPHLAGGWEFPGGKVDPGESDEEALRRECREELGVEVTLGDRIGPDLDVPPSGVLRVWLATLADPTAVPTPLEDHDLLRWVGYEHVRDLPWLPVDRPVVEALRVVLARGEPLGGGLVAGPSRIGETVRRPTGPWTPAVHDLVHHLRSAGLPLIPAVHGFDDEGREVLDHLPGRTVGVGPVPDDFRSPRLLTDIGAWTRRFHEASATFPRTARTWRRGVLAPGPGGVICHHDLSPGNVVLDDAGHLAGVLDWDMAGPGHPLDDVAYAAWQFVLRHGDPVPAEAARLQALADGYGADPVVVLDRVGPRLRGAVRFMRRGAAAGDPGLQRLVATDVPATTEAGVVALLARRDALCGAMRSAGVGPSAV